MFQAFRIHVFSITCPVGANVATVVPVMQNFTPVSALIGGAFIGIAASIMLLFSGRIAGISGMVGGSFMADAKDRPQRLLFILGLVLPGFVLYLLRPAMFPPANTVSIVPALIAGLLVGFGTRLGNGCTSGHGVCGLSRLSWRSLIATGTFMLAAGLTVFVIRHLVGGSL